MERVILHTARGGMGDGLLYSTLPELLTNLGKEVVVTQRTVERMRNKEAAKLLWVDNPFIKGIVDEPGNAGEVGTFGQDFTNLCPHSYSPIMACERLHGVPMHLVNTRPRIYYKPQARQDFRDVIVADPYSFSQACPAVYFDRFVEKLGFANYNIVVVESSASGPHGGGALADKPRYRVKDIYEYMDLIYSCKRFLSTESGGHVLANAIRKSGIYALCTIKFWNSHLFTFPNTHYTVDNYGDGSYQDYHPYP